MKRFALAVAAMVAVTGGSAEATTFNFTFDDLGGGGKGVLSVEKELTAGTFTLSEVGAFSLDFTAFGDFNFTNDNIRTSVSSVLLVVSGEAGSLNLLFSNTKPYGDGPREGSLDLIGTRNFLSFAAPGGSDGFPDNTYFTGPYGQRPFFGRYSAVEAATPAIPEPATWMMMLAGFGMIGAATRYRSRKLAVAY